MTPTDRARALARVLSEVYLGWDRQEAESRAAEKIEGALEEAYIQGASSDCQCEFCLAAGPKPPHEIHRLALAEEREACAKVAETRTERMDEEEWLERHRTKIAARIRARAASKETERGGGEGGGRSEKSEVVGSTVAGGTAAHGLTASTADFSASPADQAQAEEEGRK